MKIRQGFVSNSSSSSFIVFFPQEITNIEQLDELILNEIDSERIKLSYNSAFIDTNSKIQKKYTSYLQSLNMTFDEFRKKAILNVFNEIKNQKSNDYFAAIETLLGYDYRVNDNGYLETWNGLEFKNLKELEDAFDKINQEIDWSLPDAEEKYDELQDYQDLERIKNLIDEIDEYSNKNNNKIFYNFSYSDESGTFFSIMEHGGIWGNLDYIIKSHH